MAETTAQQLRDLADLGDLLEAREYIIDACLPMGPGAPPVALNVYDDRMGRRVYVGQASHVSQWKGVEDAYYKRRRGPGWTAYSGIDDERQPRARRAEDA